MLKFKILDIEKRKRNKKKKWEILEAHLEKHDEPSCCFSPIPKNNSQAQYKTRLGPN